MSSPAGKRGRSEDGTAIPRTVDGRITEVAAAEQLAFWQGMEASVDGMLVRRFLIHSPLSHTLSTQPYPFYFLLKMGGFFSIKGVAVYMYLR